MSNVIEVPFGIDYKAIASNVTRIGQDAVIKYFIEQGLRESVAKCLVRKALSRGWGS